jgi:hypothetical protein
VKILKNKKKGKSTFYRMVHQKKFVATKTGQRTIIENEYPFEIISLQILYFKMNVPQSDIGKTDDFNMKRHRKKSNAYYRKYLKSKKESDHAKFKEHWELSDFYFSKQCEAVAKQLQQFSDLKQKNLASA